MSEVFTIENERGIDPASLKQTLEMNEAEVAGIETTELRVTSDAFRSPGLGYFLQSRGYEPVQESDGEDGGGTFVIYARGGASINVFELQEMLEANGTGIKLQSPNARVLIGAARRDMSGLFTSLGHSLR